MAYDGPVELFYEWQLWTMKQWSKVKDGEMVRKKLTASIVEQLRCEAYYVAVNLGYKVPLEKNGIPRLVKAMKAHAFA